jgi:hypothetical protein
MPEQLSNDLTVVAQYLDGIAPASGITTPTVDVVRVNSSGATTLITGAAATALGLDGLYSYTLPAASVTVSGVYVFRFLTASTTGINSRVVICSYEVGLAGIENLDSPISEVAADVWSYSPRTLTINGQVEVTGPVVEGGNITIMRGDDYKNADGRALTWTSTDWTALDLSTATAIKFRTQKPYGTVFEKDVTAVSDTLVRLELTSAETAEFETGSKKYDFDIQATLLNGNTVTLVRAKMTVLEDVRS